MTPVEMKRYSRWMCGVGAGAMLSALACPAQADDTAAKAQPTAPDIIVTGSRVARPGYSAPTPTTAIGADEIHAAAPAQLSDYVNELPALVGSQTPRAATTSAAATVGANLYNLRSLGANRTLVLLDGHRVAPSTLTGNVDVGLLPQAIVKRVDVVTGGASAAWGSDAVAGVINYVIDTDFKGLQAEFQGGASGQGDAGSIKASLTWGTRFAQDRGHFLLSGEFHDDQSGDAVTSRGWFNSSKVMANPNYTATNGQHRYLLLPGVGLSQSTVGGLITSGPLANTQFNAAGQPVAYTPGLVSGLLSAGGDAVDVSQAIRLASPVRSFTLYGHGSFDITPDITAYGEAGYANVKSLIYARPFEADGNGVGLITIQASNAYLSPALKAQMGNTTSFTLGKQFLDWGPLVGHNDREQWRLVGGLRGKFGGDWSWDAYYQHGQTRFLNGNFSNDPIKANFNNAVDAVMGPNGTIVCRSTAAQAAGCQPFNVFGTNQGSAAALAYIYGQSVQWITIKQDVAAASLHGNPFSTWAGKVSVAAGAEYRRESYGATTTALDPTSAFFVGNSHPSSGHYDVKEGFFETVVPLVDGVPFLHHVDFNGAVRYTNYSLSGDVVSWKAGLTWDVDDQLRLRGTRSRDIRAPNLSELFQAGNTQNQTITDPLNGNKSYSVLQYQSGNPTNLKPEKADTTALGVVYRPHWLAGFGMSVDYYDIKVNSAIYTPTSASFVVGQCYTGNAVYCSSIIRDPASNLITNVALQPLNVASESTRGVDFEATYRHHAWSLRAVGTYVAQRRLTVNGATTEFAGSNANFDQSSEAVPHWRLLGTVTWTHGPVIVSATERFIGAGAISERCVVGTCTQVYDVDHNHVPAITYTDLSITLRPQGGAWAKNTEFFFAVQNLLDQAPPVAPIYGPTGFLSTGTNGFLYDLIGRQFRAGARVKF